MNTARFGIDTNRLSVEAESQKAFRFFATVQLLDWMTTIVGLSRGAVEGNRIGQTVLFGMGTYGLLCLKAVILLAVLLMIRRVCQKFPSILLAVWIATFLYVAILLNNVTVLAVAR